MAVTCTGGAKNINDAAQINILITNTGPSPINIRGTIDMPFPNGGFFVSLSFSASLGAQPLNRAVIVTLDIPAGWLTMEGSYNAAVAIFEDVTSTELDRQTCNGIITVSGGAMGVEISSMTTV